MAAHIAGRLAEAEAFYRAAAAGPARPAALAGLALIEGEAEAAPGWGAGPVSALLARESGGPGPAALEAGNMALALGRADLAEHHYRQAIAAMPDSPGAWPNLGQALAARDDLAGAAAAQEEARLRAPADPLVAYNLGEALHRAAAQMGAGHLARAHDVLCEVLTARPDYTPARLHRAAVRLALGHYQPGFSDFESRPAIPGPALPRLETGGPVARRRLLLVAEQGVGDCLHYLRYAARLAAEGAEVSVAVHPGLEGLARRVPGVKQAWRLDQLTEAAAGQDGWAPLLSLPALRGYDDPEPAGAYLRPDPTLVAAWRQRLGPANGRKRLGLVWAGNRQYGNDRRRSPGLGPMMPLLMEPGIDWFILQVGDGRDDLALQQLPASITDLGPGLKSWDDTAAVLSELDGLVSSVTGIVHLAGGLGRPVMVLTPAETDWRFGISGPQTPWYKSMTVVRQRQLAAWEEAVAVLIRTLRLSWLS